MLHDRWEVRLAKNPQSRCHKLTRPIANATYWVLVIWVMTAYKVIYSKPKTTELFLVDVGNK